jgi:hypothetical protein
LQGKGLQLTIEVSLTIGTKQWMVGKQQLKIQLPCAHHTVGVGMDDHILLDGMET